MKTSFLLLLLVLSAALSAQTQPDFSPNRNIEICGQTDVYFVCTMPAHPDNIFWDFGDGLTGTGINPVHHYTSIGTYDVKMVVEWNGVIDSLIKPAFIRIKPTPQAFFTCTKEIPFQLYTRTFTDSSHHNADSMSSLHWDVAGLALNDQPVFSHNFGQNGNFHVSLTVTNSAGCSDSMSREVEVNDEPQQPAGLEEASAISLNVAHPNPAADYTIIERAGSYELRDAEGRVLATYKTDGSRQRIDLSALKPGLYLLHDTQHPSVKPLRLLKAGA